MKVYKSKYRDHWISPYTILDYLFFWTKWSKCSRNRYNEESEKNWVDHPKWVDKAADILNPISVAIQWALNKVHPEVCYVKVDPWDTWNMDSTLSPIILPMLKQLKVTKHGYGFVEDVDVPEELRSHNVPKDEHGGWDSLAEARYDYILNEMIFAFEHLIDDSWEDAYRSGDIDIVWLPDEKNPRYKIMGHGPNHTYVCDYDGIKKVNDRIDNGLRLFGLYFRTLWD